jgi:hypothetical protein
VVDLERVDQLSLPFRIALVAVLAAGALYLVVLKPSGDPVPAPVTPAVAAAPASGAKKQPSAPGVKGLTSAADRARGAAAVQGDSDAATATAAAAASEAPTVAGAPVAIAPVKPSTPSATTVTSAPAATTTTATPAAPATTTAVVGPTEPAADPSARILAALDRRRTVVLLFAGRTAADDLAVRHALARADRRGGKVDVHVLPMGRVGDYEAITRGVQVQQSPTLLVIGKSRTARTITGFTTTSEIDQLVADVRRG